jgi:hypothetical protein
MASANTPKAIAGKPVGSIGFGMMSESELRSSDILSYLVSNLFPRSYHVR